MAEDNRFGLVVMAGMRPVRFGMPKTLDGRRPWKAVRGSCRIADSVEGGVLGTASR